MKQHQREAVKPSERIFPQQKGPWKTLGTEVKYQNPWITVREDKVICPDGSNGIYGVVEPKIAMGVVAIDSEGNLYLVGQYRYPTERYSWEIIEGGVEDGEDPLDAIKRELQEEAGLGAKKWEPLSQNIQLSNCYTAEIAHLYLASGLFPAEGVPDQTEQLEVRKVPFKDAVQMVLNGEITDALSIIGIMLAAKKIG